MKENISINNPLNKGKDIEESEMQIRNNTEDKTGKQKKSVEVVSNISGLAPEEVLWMRRLACLKSPGNN